MREQGFVNHALMGALFLGAMWFALYLPSLARAIPLGGWAAGLAIGAFAAGTLGGPLIMIFLGGDEFAGCLGILAALGLGAVFVRLAPGWLGVPAELTEVVRLCAAASAPILLLGGYHLTARLLDRSR